jgi:hypothetical protein
LNFVRTFNYQYNSANYVKNEYSSENINEKMSMIPNIKNYWAGMAAYDKCHPPTIAGQWEAFTDEVQEFIAEPSISEAWDILHTVGRLVWKLTGIPLQILALPTVYKHGQRYRVREATQ